MNKKLVMLIIGLTFLTPGLGFAAEVDGVCVAIAKKGAERLSQELYPTDSVSTINSTHVMLTLNDSAQVKVTLTRASGGSAIYTFKTFYVDVVNKDPRVDGETGTCLVWPVGYPGF